MWRRALRRRLSRQRRPALAFRASNANVSPDTQAGSHPDLTVTFELNSALNGEGSWSPSVGKSGTSTSTSRRAGGDPTAVPQCPRQQLEAPRGRKRLSRRTQVGVETVGLDLGGRVAPTPITAPCTTWSRPRGLRPSSPSTSTNAHAFVDSGVRSGGDYGLIEHADNITQQRVIYSSITLWGVPGDPSHNAERCTVLNGSGVCNQPSDTPTTPFLTLPTSCEGPLKFSAEANTWEEPSQFAHASAHHARDHRVRASRSLQPVDHGRARYQLKPTRPRA